MNNKFNRAIEHLINTGSPEEVINAIQAVEDLFSLAWLSKEEGLKWFTEFGHLNRGDMLTSEQHRCHNEKKKFQRRV